MNITSKIKSMKAEPRSWEGQYGLTWFVDGEFDDGSQFSLTTKSQDTAGKYHAELSALIGKSGDFHVEEKPEKYGKKQWKLVAWPGNPGKQGWGGGGGGRAVAAPRYRDTAEGAASERDSIHRSVALQEAVAFVGTLEPQHRVSGTVCQVADVFYDWLHRVPQGAYVKYLDAIATAVKDRDSNRLTQLRTMIADSLEKGSVTTDEVSKLDKLLTAQQSQPATPW